MLEGSVGQRGSRETAMLGFRVARVENVGTRAGVQPHDVTAFATGEVEAEAEHGHEHVAKLERHVVDWRFARPDFRDRVRIRRECGVA